VDSPAKLCYFLAVDEQNKPLNFGFAKDDFAAWSEVDWELLDAEFNQLFCSDIEVSASDS
jgi:hypothetical protein